MNIKKVKKEYIWRERDVTKIPIVKEDQIFHINVSTGTIS
jgi:hypothetical protein